MNTACQYYLSTLFPIWRTHKVKGKRMVSILTFVAAYLTAVVDLLLSGDPGPLPQLLHYWISWH